MSNFIDLLFAEVSFSERYEDVSQLMLKWPDNAAFSYQLSDNSSGLDKQLKKQYIRRINTTVIRECYADLSY